MSLLPSDASLAIPDGRSHGHYWLKLWLGLLIIPIYSFTVVLIAAPSTFIFACTSLTVALWSRLYYEIWRVRRHVKDYRTLPGLRVVLHVPEGFLGVDSLPEFLRLCEAERDEVAGLFGVRPRRRLHVFVVPTPKDLERIFGKPMGGTVWMGAIFLAADTMNQRTLRHELGHVFSHRWNAAAPPIMAEGLSTWLQEDDEGKMVDSETCRICLLTSPDLKKLLDRNYFFSESRQRSCYVLAGSFTGFLIRRHGWDRYRRFYRKTRARRFESRFRKFFGLSLMEAQRRWLDEILAMASLNQRLLDDRLFNEFA
jgi:hypothetical protein